MILARRVGFYGLMTLGAMDRVGYGRYDPEWAFWAGQGAAERAKGASCSKMVVGPT